MLKKRILASSLASVMALSSVSVVAFADETTTAAYGETVTKAELKEYVASFDAFVKDELPEYGTVQGEQFNNALKYAKSVADAKNPNTDDVIASYQMLKAVYESLEMHTLEDLADLVDLYKEDFDSKNIMNKDFGDYIWDATTYAVFSKAYKEAAAYKGSNQRVINDYYAKLESTHEGLKENDVVSKGEFRAVYTDFMNIASKFKNFESWRRGVCTVKATSGKPKDAGDKDLDLTKAKYVTYDELLNIVYGTSDNDFATTDADRGVADVSTGTWIKIDTTVPSGSGLSAAGSVKTYVENAYKYFTSNKNSTETTKKYIIDAYKAAKEAVAVFNGWNVDDVNWGNVTAIQSLLTEYQANIVKDNANVSSTGFVNNFLADSSTTIGTNSKKAADLFEWKDDTLKVKSTLTAEADLVDAGALIIDTETGRIAANAAGTGYNSAATGSRYTTLGNLEGRLTAGQDLTEYVPITNAQIVTGAEATAIAKAVKAYEAYLENELLTDEDVKARNFKALFLDGAADPNATPALPAGVNVTSYDENKTIKEGTGSMDEYTLIYRELKYALEDQYPTPAAKHTKEDIEALMPVIEELIEATGDAAKFQVNNADLAKEYNATNEWLSAANALADYKDTSPVAYTPDAATSGIGSGKTADDVYSVLNTAYEKLRDEFADYPYSYAEIVETLAEAADGVEDGVYGSSVKDLVTEISYTLSTIAPTKDCEVFTSKRAFIGYNRTFKKGTQAEKDLIANYEALIKAMEEGATEDVVKGDADGDGKVTINDALRTLKASIKAVTLSESEMKAADVDGVPGVTALDALAILKMALKIV